MPISLSAAGKIEKNKLSNTKPWILLVELKVNDDLTLYFAKNNEKIVWNNIDWIAFPIDFSDKTYDMKSIPTLDIKISNVNQVIQSYIEPYRGLVDCPVILRLVHAAHLDETEPEMEEEFNIQKTTYNDAWVTFKLGSNFYLYFRALSERYLRDYCPYKYGKIECGATSAMIAANTTCNHVLITCRAIGNSRRFGGCRGMGGMFEANQ